jgi:hypothetical protein
MKKAQKQKPRLLGEASVSIFTGWVVTLRITTSGNRSVAEKIRDQDDYVSHLHLSVTVGVSLHVGPRCRSASEQIGDKVNHVINGYLPIAVR